jgi:hypothetical protein
MSIGRKLLISLIVLGLAGGAAGAATWSAFLSSTTSSGNNFSSGTVTVGDNDLDGAVVTLPATSVPGASATGCILVTYTGSLPAELRLHGSSSGGLAAYLNLTVTRGTESAPSFPTCTGTFQADTSDYGYGPNGVVYQGALSAYPSTWASGIVDPDPTWSALEARTYRVQVTLQNDAAAQGLTGSASFQWEARNQ